MRLITPIPPSVNHAYFYRGGKKIKNTKARNFDEEVILLTRQYVKKVKKFPDKKKIICKLWYFFPDARRRDTHNTLKLLLDAVEKGGLYKDDKYVLPQIQDFCIDRDDPRVELEFKLMDI